MASTITAIMVVVSALLGSPPARGQEQTPTPESVGRHDLTLTAADVMADGSKRVGVRMRQRSNGTAVTGFATVDGAPFLPEGSIGTVDWQRSGSTVRGVIRSPEGSRVSYFEGKITAEGVSGTYATPSGVEGSWTWEGELDE